MVIDDIIWLQNILDKLELKPHISQMDRKAMGSVK
jgi:hypothetical protein